MYTIKIKNLTKRFKNFIAVDNISLNVKAGEMIGLLGPNGAGKTTIINMLSTLLRPTSGYAEVAGFDITRDKDDVRRNIGIVFQEPALDRMLTGKENLEFHAMMYQIKRKERKARLNEVLKLVELTDKVDVLVEKYSGGMKRRLEIARGLIHKPKVLFLDEPTLGLDSHTRRRIWDYIKKLNKNGEVTIILTTHYMEEADYLCDNVVIMDHGRIIAQDTPNRLKEMLGGDIISLEIGKESRDLIKHLKTIKWIKTLKTDNEFLNLSVETGDKRIPELINIIQKFGIDIISVNLHKPSLEDVFLNYTGKTIREKRNNYG